MMFQTISAELAHTHRAELRRRAADRRTQTVHYKVPRRYPFSRRLVAGVVTVRGQRQCVAM